MSHCPKCQLLYLYFYHFTVISLDTVLFIIKNATITYKGNPNITCREHVLAYFTNLFKTFHSHLLADYEPFKKNLLCK